MASAQEYYKQLIKSVLKDNSEIIYRDSTIILHFKSSTTKKFEKTVSKCRMFWGVSLNQIEGRSGIFWRILWGIFYCGVETLHLKYLFWWLLILKKWVSESVYLSVWVQSWGPTEIRIWWNRMSFYGICM